ncbi:ROK family transcriptional regulator [Lachnospiraceae bacterium 62-35]
MTQQLKQDCETMKEGNRLLVFNLIRTHSGLSRAELAKITRMSSTSIGRIVNGLMEDNLVMETGTGQNKLGRKATSLDVNPGGRFALGIDLDVYEACIGLVNLGGTLLHSRVMVFENGNYNEDRLQQIAAEAENFLDGFSSDIKENIIGIGLTVPGHILWNSGELILSPQLNLHNIRLKALFQSHFAYPVYVDNDVKSQALAERLWGMARHEPDFLMISMGNGLGISFFQNGRLLRGRDNIAGELGHIVVKPGGYLCDCGKRGCLQTYLCLSAIEKRLKKPLAEILSEAENGDAKALALIDEILEMGSVWTANLINIYNPPLIIFSGKVMKIWPDFPQQMNQLYGQYVWSHLKNSIKIVSADESPLPSNARPVLSAAAIVFYQYFLPQ